MPRKVAIEPMTLANMRANRVRSLLVYCGACPRIVVFNVDAYPEAVPVPAFGPRMVCTGCGMIGADARPNWRERYDPGQITRGARPALAPRVPPAKVLLVVCKESRFVEAIAAYCIGRKTIRKR